MSIKTVIIITVIGVISGIGIATWRIAALENSSAFTKYGSWRGTTHLAINADNLVTTQVTLFALFALPSHEAVYLFAASDDDNNRFNGDHSYSIEGNINDIKAEYWSITAYGKDLYLIPNDAKRYSFNADNIKTDAAGNFKITVGPNHTNANWLAVEKDKKFELVLRIYKGDRNFMDSLNTAHLPVIKKID